MFDHLQKITLKTTIEVWLSLVERYVRDVEVASSNLVTSTKKSKGEHLLPFDFCLCRCFEIVIFTPELQSSTVERYAWSASARSAR